MKMIKLLIPMAVLLGSQFVLAQSPPENKRHKDYPIWIPFDLSTEYSYSDIFKAEIKKGGNSNINIDGNGNRRIDVSAAVRVGNVLNIQSSQSPQYLTDIEMRNYDVGLRKLLYEVLKFFSGNRDIETHFMNAQYYKNKKLGGFYDVFYKNLGGFYEDIAMNNPILLYFVQQKQSTNPAYTKGGIMSPKSGWLSFWSKEKFIYMAITSKIKSRACFTNNSDEESIKTTMAHEMGHVFLIHRWPELRILILKWWGGMRTLKHLPAYVAHEAFAVYTEYLYLKNNNNVQNFNIIDFIRDSADDTGMYSVYSVDPDYMLCFLKALDYENMEFDNQLDLNVTDIPFNYDFLSTAQELCKKLEDKKNIVDAEYKIILKEEQATYRYCSVQKRNVKEVYTEEVSSNIDFRLLVEPFEEESKNYLTNTLSASNMHWSTGFQQLKELYNDPSTTKAKKRERRNIARKNLIRNVLNELTNNQLKKYIELSGMNLLQMQSLKK